MSGPTVRALVCLVFAVMALGCSDNATTSGPERQQELLRDPFGYKMDDSNDISGGNITQFDREAVKKDIGNVLNP